MLLAFSACGLVLLQQTQAAAPPAADKAPVDRSAEPALKAIFAATGALRNVHVSSEYYNWEADATRWDDDSSADLWMEDPSHFRMSYSGNYWGGGKTVVCDGTSCLVDNMEDDQVITVSKLKPLHEASDQEPVLYLLEGESAFDTMVLKDKPVVFENDTDASEKSILLSTKGFGKIRIAYDPATNLPIRIDKMDAPYWYDTPNTNPNQPFQREYVSINPLSHVDASMFRIVLPKDHKVADQRKS